MSFVVVVFVCVVVLECGDFVVVFVLEFFFSIYTVTLNRSG